MRFHRRVLALLPALGFATFGFAGQAAWNPPKTSLTPEIVEGTQFLLRHGLGDPRGGEYRSVKLAGESSPFVTEVRGWVLPEQAGQPRQVVTLNGMVYPVQEIGAPADVEEDLFNPSRSFWGFSNSRLGTASAVTTALLLLRGETERAERYYQKSSNPSFPGAQFVGMGAGYLGATWERAVNAHKVGDAAKALEIGRHLASWRPDFEAEALRRLGEQTARQRYSPDLREGEPAVIFRFLGPLDSLVHDSQRRVSRGAKKVDLAAIKRMPLSERVPALVDALDEVSVQQMGQPGSVIFGEDPVVQALDEAGEAALPSLFNAVENDRRLTRSVGFWRDFGPDRQLKSVRDAAVASIQIILQTFDLSGGKEPFDLGYAKSLWLRTKGMSPAQRWLAVLQDDAAGERKWQEAAESLFKRQSVHMIAQTSWRGPSKKPGAAKDPFKAEALPASQRPLLTAALMKRTRQLANEKLTSPYDLVAPLNTLESLALWDNRVARPVGKEVLSKTFAYLQDQDLSGGLGHLGAPIGEAVDALARGGDFEALAAYARFLAKVPVASSAISDSRGKLLAPFLNFKGDPRVSAMTRDLIQKETSPFYLPRIARSWQGTLDDLVTTPLFELEVVRQSILDLLDDKTELGTIEARPNQMVALYSPKGEQVMSFSPSDSHPFPATGERMPFRVSDSLMISLSRLKGAPSFVPYAPLGDRDKAVVEMKQFLRANVRRVVEILPEHSRIWWDINQ